MHRPRLAFDYFKALRVVVFAGLALYFGGPLLIPLAFALLLAFVLYPVTRRLEERGMPRLLASIIGLLIVLVLAGGLGWLFVRQMQDFIKEWPRLQGLLASAIESYSDRLEKAFHVTKSERQDWLDSLGSELPSKLLPFMGSGLSSLASGGIALFLIAIYTVLILQYRGNLLHVFYCLFPDGERHNVRNVLSEVVETYYRFFTGVAAVYLIVGILNSLGLWIMGVPHPILFGFIASVLTFIPYFGILVGGSLPVAIAWIEHGDPLYAMGVVGIFVVVQFLEAYLIFPWIVSYRLKVNTLFIFIAMFAGHLLWGLSGMILFIPFTAILKLVSDRVPGLAPISVLLGQERK